MHMSGAVCPPALLPDLAVGELGALGLPCVNIPTATHYMRARICAFFPS